MNSIINLQINLKPAVGQMDSLDSLIIATILLFILSTINEKLTEMVRMYPRRFRLIGILFCLFVYFEIVHGYFSKLPLSPKNALLLGIFNTVLLVVILANTFFVNRTSNKFYRVFNKLGFFRNIKKGSPIDEKEKEVTALSFMLGLIIAFSFNANLFNFFNPANPPGLTPKSPFAKPPNPYYAFDPAFFDVDFITAIGFVLTAFFLAFGAKFFHDLLDMLFQIKNLKRKANEAAEANLESIEEFDKFILKNENAAFKEFLDKKFNKPGVFYESDIDNRTLYVTISDPAIIIEPILLYEKPSGKKIEIKVIIKKGAVIRTLGAPIFSSSEIANKVPYNGKLRGTLGGFVKEIDGDSIYMLTCYHVVWNNHNWDRFGGNSPKNVVHPFGGGGIGEIFSGIKNTKIDAALISIKDVVPINELDGIGPIEYSRDINDGDLNTTVRMRGSKSSNFTGYISEIKRNINVLYPDGLWKELQDVMVIKTRNGKPFSYEGDSGSLVVDAFGLAIGMIVAGDQIEYSFAIPFSEIRNQLNVDIYKTTKP